MVWRKAALEDIIKGIPKMKLVGRYREGEGQEAV